MKTLGLWSHPYLAPHLFTHPLCGCNLRPGLGRGWGPVWPLVLLTKGGTGTQTWGTLFGVQSLGGAGMQVWVGSGPGGLGRGNGLPSSHVLRTRRLF